MRQFGILLALSGAVTLAAAQTDTSKPEYSPLSAPRASTSLAGEASPATSLRRMSLQDCIELTLRNNIDLKIDRINPEIARYSLEGAFGYDDPTFMFSGQHDHTESGSQLLSGGFSLPGSVTDAESFRSSLGGSLPWGTTYTLSGNVSDSYGTSRGNPFESSSGSASVSVTQPLLKNFWIDQPRLSILVAKNRVKYSEQALRLQVIQTITTLEQAYYLLIYDRALIEVQSNAVVLAEQLVKENKKRLEVGSLAPLDLESAEAQAAQSRAALLQAQIQLGTQERVLKSLMTDRFRDWADIAIEPTGTLTAPPPTLSRQDSWRKGLNQRPEMVQAKLDLERMGIVLKYDRNQLYPELDVFASFGYNGSGKEFSDAFYEMQRRDRPFYTYGGRISMPLSRTSARYTYAADKASLQQLDLTLQRLEERIMIEIDDDIGSIMAAYDRVKATQTARQYAESALNAEQKKLASGKSTTYTVLQMQRDLTSARGSEIQALTTYNTSLSQLSLDESSTLDRLKINFEVR